MRTVGTSSTHQHFVLKMSASLAKQFEDCAARCLELARAAKTAGRARFMQMTREYQSAAALIRQEPLHLSAHYRNGWHPLPPPMISTDGTKRPFNPVPRGVSNQCEHNGRPARAAGISRARRPHACLPLGKFVIGNVAEWIEPLCLHLTRKQRWSTPTHLWLLNAQSPMRSAAREPTKAQALVRDIEAKHPAVASYSQVAPALPLRVTTGNDRGSVVTAHGRLAPPLRPLARLAQVQEPSRESGARRKRIGLSRGDNPSKATGGMKHLSPSSAFAEPDRVLTRFVATSAKAASKPAASTGRRAVGSSDEPVKATRVRLARVSFDRI